MRPPLAVNRQPGPVAGYWAVGGELPLHAVQLRLAPGQAWHLPVGPPVTPDEIVAIFNAQRSTDFSISYLPAFLRKALSLFIPPLREVNEMVYQFNEPYLMSAEMFLAHFPDFRVTPYDAGIAAMIRSFNEAQVG